MKFLKKNINEKSQAINVNKRIHQFSTMPMNQIYKELNSGIKGLGLKQVEINRQKFGLNKVISSKHQSFYQQLLSSFINPFTLILILLAVVSMFTDIILVKPGKEEPATVIIIVVMVLISGIIRFVQEFKSEKATESLMKMVKSSAMVHRYSLGAYSIAVEEVVVGDIISLAAGDLVPGDCRIIQAKDLFVSQASLTGETNPVEKVEDTSSEQSNVIGLNNIVFFGSNIVSGSGLAIVIAVGNQSVFGNMAQSLEEISEPSAFEKGISDISWLLLRFMMLMVPIVFIVNGIVKGDWLIAFVFAVSIAVGLTPEMLPMIVSASLAKGAVAMAKEKTIVKNLNAIQNLGSIDILCTDKTGTLTQDRVALQYYLNVNGEEDPRVLRHAFLNSYYQTGLKNLIDRAIIEKIENDMNPTIEIQGLTTQYRKIDEIPFDFQRRKMSVVTTTINNSEEKVQIITKGAVEEMLEVCSFVEYEGVIKKLNKEMKKTILNKVDELNDQGMRVIAIAQKTDYFTSGQFSIADEQDMVFMGYLVFLDPPKESTKEAIKALDHYGVKVKIVTGDNDKVTRSVCMQVGLPTSSILLGDLIEQMDDETLSIEVLKYNHYAKCSPHQKERIIRALQANNHTVGYLGDGINDALSLKVSDVGISVDTAVDIAKETADVILLSKDLMVLEKGIIQGRITYVNMIKYLKLTISSNFGNMFSVLVASAFLPFLPMLPIHLIVLNLVSDLSLSMLPWDSVDEEYLKSPKQWSAKLLKQFMLVFGPLSSIFDIMMFVILFYGVSSTIGFGQGEIVFQTGWFIFSMWSQTLVLYLMRNDEISIFNSKPSKQLIISTMLGILIITVLPYTTLGHSINLISMPLTFYIALAGVLLGYLLSVLAIKKIFLKKGLSFL